MDRHYSTLELVKHDETARAPERDWDATAFELDGSALAPQAVPDSTPEVFYNNSFPEVHGNIEESANEQGPSHHIPKPALKWPLMVIIIVFAAAIAVGVGVGIWRHREHVLHKSSTVISPPAPQSHNITPAAQFILNDTSLAALSLSNGDRQLFFQDNTGRIRRAIRTESNNQWSTSPYLNLSSNPKNYTPLVATAYYEVVELKYVSESHTLVSVLPDPSSDDSWTPDTTFGNWSTAMDTRSLSFNSLNETFTGNSTISSALLYYENPTGNISALLQRTNAQDQSQWVDITPQGSKSLPTYIGTSFTFYELGNNATFSTPFTSAANFAGNTITALFYSPNISPKNGGPVILTSGYNAVAEQVDPGGPGYLLSGGSMESANSSNYSSINQSDTATFDNGYAIWINGTQPVIIRAWDYTVPLETPNNSFPFARLASVTFETMTFLYHQIDGTTFAEEQWDASENAWTSSENFTVSDP